MRTQPLTLLAVIGLVACWSAVALAWLGGAIYYESRAPAAWRLSGYPLTTRCAPTRRRPGTSRGTSRR